MLKRYSFIIRFKEPWLFRLSSTNLVKVFLFSSKLACICESRDRKERESKDAKSGFNVTDSSSDWIPFVAKLSLAGDVSSFRKDMVSLHK